MAIRSTAEQLAVRKSKAKLLVVKAMAGTGKTTTLVGYSQDRPKARILYLAYNKSMAVAAAGKFPSNVECKTTHSLAYRQFGRPYADANKLGNVRGSDVMMNMKLDAMFAKTVLETVNNFIYSADDKLTDEHVPASVIHRRDGALENAIELWAAMRAMPGEHKLADRIKMPHDGYLKLYQLSRPDLTAGRYGYDIVLADEWQDANPVSADIVARQKCIRVMVGDSHQSIYAFRKSVDALNIAADSGEAEVLYLTQSFRFGADVASMATALLAGFKCETKPLIGVGGAERIATTVDRSKLYTKICRTNAQVFASAVEFLGTKRVNFIGGVENYPFERLVDVQRLADGKLNEVQDPFFRQMGSIGKLQDYVNKVNDKEVGALLSVQKEYTFRIPGLVDEIRAVAVETAEQADVQLTTAHRSKGLEWEQTELADDFEVFITEDGGPKFLDTQELNEELNLLYVAMTRASHALEVNSSIKDALEALGDSEEFEMAAGVQESALTDSLLAGQLMPQLSLERVKPEVAPESEPETEIEPEAPKARPVVAQRPARPAFQPVARKRVVPSLAELAAQDTPATVALAVAEKAACMPGRSAALSELNSKDVNRQRAVSAAPLEQSLAPERRVAVLDAPAPPAARPRPWDRARFRR